MSFLEPDVVSTEICNFEIVVILNVFVNSPIGYVLLSLTFLLKIPFRAHSIILHKATLSEPLSAFHKQLYKSNQWFNEFLQLSKAYCPQELSLLQVLDMEFVGWQRQPYMWLRWEDFTSII